MYVIVPDLVSSSCSLLASQTFLSTRQAGHESQTLGLLRSLETLIRCGVFRLSRFKACDGSHQRSWIIEGFTTRKQTFSHLQGSRSRSVVDDQYLSLKMTGHCWSEHRLLLVPLHLVTSHLMQLDWRSWAASAHNDRPTRL